MGFGESIFCFYFPVSGFAARRARQNDATAKPPIIKKNARGTSSVAVAEFFFHSIQNEIAPTIANNAKCAPITSCHSRSRMRPAGRNAARTAASGSEGCKAVIVQL